MISWKAVTHQFRFGLLLCLNSVIVALVLKPWKSGTLLLVNVSLRNKIFFRIYSTLSELFTQQF